MRHKSTYIVIFQHTFFDDLFHQNLQNINPAFHCLTNPMCLADFVSSRCTDLNLNDGRFWLNMNLRALSTEDIGCTTEWNRYYMSEIETEEEMIQLFRHFHPNMKSIKAPFVPYLGQLNLCRNAIPNCRRSETHYEVASLFQSFPDKSAMFGLSTTGDQSLSHVSLTVGKGKKVHLRETSSDCLDKISLPNAVIRADCSLRVHFYPYGLSTSYLIISLSAPQGFSTTDLIVFLNRLFSSKEGSSDSISCIVGKHYSGPMIQLHDWVRTCVSRAVLRSPETRHIRSPQLHAVVCLNTEQVVEKLPESVHKEIIGILARDVNWNDFNISYASSFSSFFGKYAGECALSTSDNLLLSFGSTWKQYNNNKSRVRFYWSLLNIFEYIIAQKYLCSLFVEEVKKVLRERPGNPETESHINRIGTWLDSMEHQHTKLDSPHRKFFHKATEVLNLDMDRYNLARSLDQYQDLLERTQKAESYDYILSSLYRLRNELHAEIVQVHHQYFSLEHKIGSAITTWEDQQKAIEIALDEIHQRIQEVVKLSRGDIFGYEKHLVGKLGEGTWNTCRNETKLFLLTAEYLYNTTDPRADFSGAMIEYCKALEVELNGRILDRLIPYIVKNVAKRYVAAGRQKVGPNDLTRLTLGAFPYLLARSWFSELTRRTYSNSQYDEDFTDFFDSQYSGSLILTNDERRESLAITIQTIADYRNGAAHMRGVTKSEATKIRKVIINTRTLNPL